MTTFSRIIDELALSELQRPNMRLALSSYLNQSIREVHTKRGGGASVLFPENRHETIFQIVSLPALWPIPSGVRFQQLEAAYVPEMDRYLKHRNPSIAFSFGDEPSKAYYYYRSGRFFAFNGVSLQQSVKISYFLYPRNLEYFLNDTGPAQWDAESEQFVDTVTREPLAYDSPKVEAVSHWLLYRHGESLKEGVRAKYYQRVNNEEQARNAWSNFENARESIHFSEGV